MTTAVAERPQTAAKPAPPRENTIAYKPLGSKIEVELTIPMVRRFLCIPTKSGYMPTDEDVVKYMMLCKARELDPWVGDSFLTGYDTKDGPKFSLITSHQALLKRAEINEAYDGLESGVIFRKKDQTIADHRQGDLILEDEVLLGAWARCHRKDRKIAAYDAIKLSTFDTGYSRWAKDPAGMIVKCAEASVLRASFPTQIGGLYTAQEMQVISQERIEARGTMEQERENKAISELEAFTDRITQPKANGEPKHEAAGGNPDLAGPAQSAGPAASPEPSQGRDEDAPGEPNNITDEMILLLANCPTEAKVKKMDKEVREEYGALLDNEKWTLAVVARKEALAGK